MNQHTWDNELKQWIERSKSIENSLAEFYIHFFTLVFENTSCPERAWFGILDHAASLVVGNIYLAAVIKRGKQEDKGIWLLLQDVPNVDGWRSWNTRSTQAAPGPLKWFHTPFFDKVVDVLDNSDIWQSFQIASSRILDFPVVASDRDEVQQTRKKLRLSTIYAPSNNPLDEIDEYRSSYVDLQETERQAVVQSRIGQGKFRADLIRYWNGCAVTGCKTLEILRASHIKPWSKADNAERLDSYNGLLLTPNLDVAFDAGYISFADDGNIIISRFLTEDDQGRLGIHSELKIGRLTEQHIKYLQYHRDHKFKGV